MLEKLSHWIKHIILVIMFSSFIEFLIPNNKYSKYIRVVLGSFIILTILNPIISIFYKGNVIDGISFCDKNLYQDSVIAAEAENFNQKNDEIIVKNFKKNISTVIKEQLKVITSLEVKKVKIELIDDTDKSNFGQINQIIVILSEKKHQQYPKKEIKIKAEKVKDTSNDNILQTKNKELEIQKIKDYLKIQYSVPFENIHVKMEGY